ncbi:unnamed protein product [Soboliphyme baturini]|uniref:Uncharacterized protein n=1 Tax=Soboliphyme baturini TaxID=241478 RepID=A0A183IPF8_9BILA|nr:unnamed protein product [Soboliphyme baturini]
MNLFIDLVIIFICISFYVLLCLFCLYHKSSNFICPSWVNGRDVRHLGSHRSGNGSTPGVYAPSRQVVSTISSSVSLDMPPSYDEILPDRKETPPPSYNDVSLILRPPTVGKTVPYSTDC